MTDYTGKHMGNYRLTRLLGQGGFAEVYLGEHVHLGTQAAIKLLLAPLVGAAEVEKFRREARTIATLVHPHIVRVLEFGVEEGLPYLVLDYAPGGTLRLRHPQGIPLAPLTILPYVQQVSQALQYAHDRQIIHRDIKPQNLLIGRQNEILLSDFGISTVAESKSRQQSEEFAGTATYAAPEQMQGHAQLASDQYALGVVVYEWLTGSLPFTGSLLEVMWKHVQSPPPPLHQRIPTLTPQIEQTVLKAMAKDPGQRFKSEQDFALAFERACQKEPPSFTTSPAIFAPQSIVASPVHPAPRANIQPQRASSVSSEPSSFPPASRPSPTSKGWHPPASSPERKEGVEQRHQAPYRLAKLWARGLALLASCVELGIVGILLRFTVLPFPLPLQTEVLQHPAEALILGGILLATAIIAVLFWQGPGEPLEPSSTNQHLPRRLLISNLLATASTLLFVSLLLVVLIRPAWCPTALCPATQGQSTAIPGVHDDNLEVTLTAVESTFYVIPGDPAQYSLDHLPTSIAAQRIDEQNVAPYRVVVGVHGLQHGSFSLLIHRVYLLVVQASSASTPLNVWSQSARDYNTNLYQVTYNAETPDAAILSTPAFSSDVQLAPGESDDLDLQVTSLNPIDLQFRVRVEYRVTNESAFHILTLPTVFESDFTDASNWHLYHLQNGHFTPGP